MSDAGGGSEVIVVRVLGPGDVRVLNRVAPGVFDNAIDARLAAEFVTDPRHHLAVAIDGSTVVGMASAVHYVHPDKPPELWINEVGVAESHWRRGIGRRLMQALLERGRQLGCGQAWVATDEANLGAQRLYSSVGGVPEAAIIFTIPITRRRHGESE